MILCAAVAVAPGARADSIETLGQYDFDGTGLPAMTIVVPRPTGVAGSETALIRIDSNTGLESPRAEPPEPEYPWDHLFEGESRTTIDFLDRFIAFVRDFGEQSDHHTTGWQFRSTFLHEISQRLPGFAWVLVVYSSRAREDNIEISREGGGLGVQIPLIGSRKLFLDPDTGALVLRVLPIAGNLERVVDYSDPADAIEGEDNGIRIRPTAEIEWRYRMWGLFNVFEPGVRALVQPNVLDPGDVRVMAEVFVGIRFPVRRGIFQGLRFTPRCTIDFTTRDEEILRAAGSFQVAGRWVSCSVNASFELGN